MISIEDQIASAYREVRFRRRVYERRVAEGKMTRRQADHEIAAMEAIAATLESMREQKTASPTLL